jgi:hypothetical protein
MIYHIGYLLLDIAKTTTTYSVFLTEPSNNEDNTLIFLTDAPDKKKLYELMKTNGLKLVNSLTKSFK